MASAKQSAVLVAVLLASVAAGYLTYTLSQPERDVATAMTEPAAVDTDALADLALLTPSGEAMPMSTWQGQPQVVNFWATWCGPCREEMPVLVKAYKDYADQGLVVIGLSMDYPEDTALVAEFAEEYGVDFPILMAVEQGNRLADSYGADNFVLPITVFIKADGSVSNVHTGLLTAEQAEEQLRQLF